MFFKKKKETDVEVLQKIKEKITEEDSKKQASSESKTVSDEDFLNNVLAEADTFESEDKHTKIDDTKDKQSLLENINNVVREAVDQNDTETNKYKNKDITDEDLLDDLMNDDLERLDENAKTNNQQQTAGKEQQIDNVKIGEKDDDNFDDDLLDDVIDESVDEDDDDNDDDEKNSLESDDDAQALNAIDDDIFDKQADSGEQEQNLSKHLDNAGTNYNSTISKKATVHDFENINKNVEKKEETNLVFPNVSKTHLQSDNMQNKTYNIYHGNFTENYNANEQKKSSQNQDINNNISDKTKSNVKGSITDLIENVKHQILINRRTGLKSTTSARTMDQFIADLLRPQLIEYLDKNLDRIVKEIVHEEIQKIVDSVDGN